jgi:hypothetical protein
MLFLLGLFLGCVLGVILAGLCNVISEKTANLSTASGPKVIEGAAECTMQASFCRVFDDASAVIPGGRLLLSCKNTLN